VQASSAGLHRWTTIIPADYCRQRGNRRTFSVRIAQRNADLHSHSPGIAQPSHALMAYWHAVENSHTFILGSLLYHSNFLQRLNFLLNNNFLPGFSKK
jgi:phosphatidylserine/phosphatidylglycerophosphate/cardiolipin synthase-like enzyme